MVIVMRAIEIVEGIFTKVDKRLQESIKRGDVPGTALNSALRSAAFGSLLSLQIVRALRDGDRGLALRKAGGALILPPVMLFVAVGEMFGAYSNGVQKEIRSIDPS